MIPPCLTFSNIRYVSRVKWNNPGKGVVPYPTSRCCSYWKGSLLVILDYRCQLYFLFALFFMLQQKQAHFQSRGHYVTLSEAAFLPVDRSHAESNSYHSWWRTLSLKLLPPLSCWRVTSAGSEPLIEASNNLRELGLNYMLHVAWVQFP